MAFGVGELGQGHHVGDLRDRHGGLPAQALGLVQAGLEVIHLDVEGYT